MFGLTAAIKSGLSVREGAIEQSNFHDFALLRSSEVPQIDIEFIESNEAPGGLGEAGVPLAAPAVSNAVFAATGERLRTLPLEWHDRRPWRHGSSGQSHSTSERVVARAGG